MSTDLYDDGTQTVAHFLEQLGGVSPRRVLMKPPPGKATEKDLLRHQRRTGRVCELVDGTLVEKPVSYNESYIVSKIIIRAGLHAETHKLGKVTGEQGAMRLMPSLVRIPDVAFVRAERFPGGKLPEGPIPNLYPDLAVEVLSESNIAGEIRRQLKDYFLAGTTLAWVVDPKKRTVAVHTAPDAHTTLTESDTLDGGTVEDLPVVLSLLGEAKRRLAKLQHETSHSLAKLQGRLPDEEEAKLLALAKDAPTGEQIAPIREKRGYPRAWHDDSSDPFHVLPRHDHPGDRLGQGLGCWG